MGDLAVYLWDFSSFGVDEKSLTPFLFKELILIYISWYQWENSSKIIEGMESKDNKKSILLKF